MRPISLGLMLASLSAVAAMDLDHARVLAQSRPRNWTELSTDTQAPSSPHSPSEVGAPDLFEFRAGQTAQASLSAVSPASAEKPPLGADDPGGPPRIAQYPLENDPYEGPPAGSQAPGYSQSGSPQTSSPTWSAEPELQPWVKWESTQIAGTYLHDTPDGLGWSDVVAKGTIEFPHAPFVWLSPQIGAHYLSDAGLADVPSRLYDASLEVAFGFPLSEKWIFQGGVSPGVFSDFEGAGGDVIRVPFRGLLFYKWSSALTLGGGFLYLDRPDISGLPLLGLSYIPSDDFRCELWFPRPKVSWRYFNHGDVARWFYLLGEFGGGSWAVRRDDGVADSFAYRDYRLMAGVEQKCPTGLGWFVEGGFIFGRRMSFARADRTVDLNSTAGMQTGVRF